MRRGRGWLFFGLGEHFQEQLEVGDNLLEVVDGLHAEFSLSAVLEARLLAVQGIFVGNPFLGGHLEWVTILFVEVTDVGHGDMKYAVLLLDVEAEENPGAIQSESLVLEYQVLSNTQVMDEGLAVAA